ncbi:MAG: class I mannose-6-phosphate isomerase [Bacteroidales bacterium]|nr:class I mannose-6-phosphate isomerase [Bacteroidales bacterium]
MSVLYPLKFAPAYFEKIWGGQHVKTILHQDFGDLMNCGEMWLLSGLEGQNSIVCNGDFAGDELNDLIETFMGDLVGEDVFNKYGERFPLLIKIIDPLDNLSIQVHPDDELAQKIGLYNGKTEMWYVMNAEKGAKLVSGFNRDVTPKEFEEAVANKSVEGMLNYVDVHNDDTFFIPARKIHALGAGCMVAEIQQTSDTSYRVYDWDRIDRFGMKRELHIDEALATINFKKEDSGKVSYDKKTKNATVSLVKCPYFTTNLIKLDTKSALVKDYSELDSFVILMSTEGSFILSYENGTEAVRTGECILIPNVINKVEIISDGECKLLEVYIV